MEALIVDDDQLALELLSNALGEMGYHFAFASNGSDAIEQLRSNPTSRLVITDWEMPEMNGLELCQAIRKEDFQGYIYIIMLTAKHSSQQKLEALYAGADAFLAKPFNPAELLVSLKTAERILALETRDVALYAMAKLAESRDPETGTHIERVQSYSRVLAHYLGTLPQFRGQVDPEYVRLIYQTSPLHDIGKVGIPDSVLLKPGKFNEAEFTLMKTHSELGAHTLDAALQRFPNAKFLQLARDIAMTHHEKFDGTGYPKGLTGEQIPLCGRIVALADVYDALTSRRIYKAAMTHHQARDIIQVERGHHFDPVIVDAFLATEQQFIAIKTRLDDSDDTGAGTSKSSSNAAAAIEEQECSYDVLLVDDDPIQLEMAQRPLRQAGYKVIVATNGREAFQICSEKNPRVVISDWVMPEVDGMELCRQIRSTPNGAYVYFVMLTVHGDKARLMEAFEHGVDDFIRKPFDELDLLARVRAGLRAARLHDDLLRRNQGSQELNEHLSGLNKRLEAMALTDDLTGLYNHRHAMRRLEENWAQAERYKRPLSVLIVDIDHFKLVNDTYGHAAGDVVLRDIAEILRQTARTTDTVCRNGGEEFLVICPSETAHEAAVCAERCRLAVMQHQFIVNDKPIRVTTSTGVASRRPPMQQFTDLLSDADAALYRAKRAGRNTVTLAEGLLTKDQLSSILAAAKSVA